MADLQARLDSIINKFGSRDKTTTTSPKLLILAPKRPVVKNDQAFAPASNVKPKNGGKYPWLLKQDNQPAASTNRLNQPAPTEQPGL